MLRLLEVLILDHPLVNLLLLLGRDLLLMVSNVAKCQYQIPLLCLIPFFLSLHTQTTLTNLFPIHKSINGCMLALF